MIGLSDDLLRERQHEVQRVMGQCLLRLQEYELRMKAILAQHKVSGPVASIEEARAARVDDVDRKTLGTLVGKLFNSFLVVDGKQGRRGESDDDPPFAFRSQVALSVDDFAQTEIDLRELVALRNDLVHHFLEQHDLSSLAVCDGALDALSAASARIEQANDGLRSWAKDMNQMRRRAAEIFVLPAVQDFILTGGIPWPITGIVRALREAEANLAIGGWTPVARAGRWISA